MEAQDLIGDVLRKIFSDSGEALAYSENPTDYLVAEGLGDIDMNGIDMGQAVASVANELALDNSVTQTLINVSEPVPAGPVLAPLAQTSAPAAAAASSSGGGSSSAAAASSGGSAPAAVAATATAAPAAEAPAPVQITSLEQIQQVVNNYTTVVYEGDSPITNNLFDNSQTLELDFSDVEGDIDLEIDIDAVNANGDGAVAAGDDIEDSQIVTGDGAVAVDGSNDGVINTGENSGVIAQGDVDDVIIGDGNTQVGEADNVVSGDGNTINQVDGSDNLIQSGDGNESTQVDGDDATLIDSGGGEVTATDIDASGDAEVSAVVGDGNATVQGEDNNASFGSGDVADFGSENEFDEAQIGFGGSVNQDNDVADSGNTTVDQSDNSVDESTNVVIDDSLNTDASTNDSGNVEVEIEATFDESFNSADDLSNEQVTIAEAGDGDVVVEDAIDG